MVKLSRYIFITSINVTVGVKFSGIRLCASGCMENVVWVVVQVITKDSNVMVVAVAGNIVAGLATGLRKSFQTYAPSVRESVYMCLHCVAYCT